MKLNMNARGTRSASTGTSAGASAIADRRTGPKLQPSAASARFASPGIFRARTQSWRSRMLFGALSLAFLGLAGRSIYLQTASQPFLQAQGAQTYERTIEMPANRGRILDRNGAVLAAGMPASAVAIAPKQVDLSDPRLMDLARLLGMKPTELQKRLTRPDASFQYLKHQVDVETSERIRALRIRGVVLESEYKRSYPQGEVAAQLVGFTNFEDRGQEGMELAFQRVLKGDPGSRRVVRDGTGQIIAAYDSVQEPRDGQDLRLTIDSRIQSQTFNVVRETARKFNAKAAAAVVVDAQNGEVLALANWPSYDPNNRAKLSGEQLRNRVLVDTFEPGSTIKPFTAAMALESGRYRPNSIIDAREGKLTVGPDTIRDSHRHKELMTLEQVVQKSSNVGIAKVALDLPAERLDGMLRRSGFGTAPKLQFPGVVNGRLRAVDKWKPIEHVTISYGHGLSVSLLQLAQAYTIFADRGELSPLKLVARDGEGAAGMPAPSMTPGAPADDADGPVRTWKVANHGARGGVVQATMNAPVNLPRGDSLPVIKPETAAAIRHMLEMAVDREGTAPQARISGYRVGGKTGTAHKQEHGRYVQKYVSSFVGLAPMSNPRIVVAVMIDEPEGKAYYGGQVAGPAFASIASEALRTLRVEPDAPYQTVIAPAQDAQPDGSANARLVKAKGDAAKGGVTKAHAAKAAAANAADAVKSGAARISAAKANPRTPVRNRPTQVRADSGQRSDERRGGA